MKSPCITEIRCSWASSDSENIQFECIYDVYTWKWVRLLSLLKSRIFLSCVTASVKRHTFSMRCKKGQPEGSLEQRNDCLATHTTNTATMQGRHYLTVQEYSKRAMISFVATVSVRLEVGVLGVGVLWVICRCICPLLQINYLNHY